MAYIIFTKEQLKQFPPEFVSEDWDELRLMPVIHDCGDDCLDVCDIEQSYVDLSHDVKVPMDQTFPWDDWEPILTDAHKSFYVKYLSNNWPIVQQWIDETEKENKFNRDDRYKNENY